MSTTGDIMKKSYAYYIENSILKQNKFSKGEIKNLIFKKPRKVGTTDVIYFTFIIELENNKINISGHICEYNNKISLNYTDEKNSYNDNFEFENSYSIVRKSMIINPKGEYESQEDIIKTEKCLLLERK